MVFIERGRDREGTRQRQGESDKKVGTFAISGRVTHTFMTSDTVHTAWLKSGSHSAISLMQINHFSDPGCTALFLKSPSGIL